MVMHCELRECIVFEDIEGLAQIVGQTPQQYSAPWPSRKFLGSGLSYICNRADSHNDSFSGKPDILLFQPAAKSRSLYITCQQSQYRRWQSQVWNFRQEEELVALENTRRGTDGSGREIAQGDPHQRVLGCSSKRRRRLDVAKQ